MRVVLIADTHGLHGRMAPVPDGDLLVHAGDLTGHGSLGELELAFGWLARLPHRHKVVIAGNHDFALELAAEEAEALVREGVHYLLDDGVEIDGLRIWGSPWQPWFYDWAFNLERGRPLAEKWALIPDDTDLLVTHGPPQGVLDRTSDGRMVGCEELAARLPSLRRLQLHVFGHIHEAYGRVAQGSLTLVNASICDLAYRPINQPVVVDL